MGKERMFLRMAGGMRGSGICIGWVGLGNCIIRRGGWRMRGSGNRIACMAGGNCINRMIVRIWRMWNTPTLLILRKIGQNIKVKIINM